MPMRAARGEPRETITATTGRTLAAFMPADHAVFSGDPRPRTPPGPRPGAAPPRRPHSIPNSSPSSIASNVASAAHSRTPPSATRCTSLSSWSRAWSRRSYVSSGLFGTASTVSTAGRHGQEHTTARGLAGRSSRSQRRLPRPADAPEEAWSQSNRRAARCPPRRSALLTLPPGSVSARSSWPRRSGRERWRRCGDVAGSC